MDVNASILLTHELVAAQADDSPDAVAIVSSQQSLTYAGLHHRSSQVAKLLSTLDLRPNSLIALYAERSVEFAVGALGIWKAGAAYLPIDPASPPNRVAHLLKEARTSIVLTQRAVKDRIPPGDWITVDLDGPEVNRCATACNLPVLNRDDLAYVIFTSGSTGRPKGVEITHANLSNLIQWHNRAFAVTNADRATQQASVGFDASVWELWPYLASGASVHIVDEALRYSAEDLRDWIVGRRITISFLPTALAEQAIQLSWPSPCSLRFLLTGADTLRRRPPQGLPFQLVNNYGPTECTVVATSGIVAEKDSLTLRPSIGLPIDNARIYFINESLQPVQDGPGEIVIGGAGVGRGYLGNPDLTAQRFISNPSGSGDRVYRTGDLGRRLPSGEIEFLGRLDDQIKIRGYRIEPLEVMAALDRHPGVGSSFVTAREDQAGDPALVAYVTPATSSLTAGELRRFLQDRIPAYMIPAIFIEIASLPLSENGKVDRHSLPDPGPDNIMRDDDLQEPTSLIEGRVAEIVQDLLRIPRIGRDDNFFTLGGHSLMGAQMLARVRDAFGVEIPLLALFEHPTVREVSMEIEEHIAERIDRMSDEEVQQLLAS